jgi:hypothetical protein
VEVHKRKTKPVQTPIYGKYAEPSACGDAPFSKTIISLAFGKAKGLFLTQSLTSYQSTFQLAFVKSFISCGYIRMMLNIIA